jgi:hypothetical protein
MLTRLLSPSDPFEGRGARRRRLRLRIESTIAFAMAITACGLTAAAWLDLLMPVIRRTLGV